MPHKMSLTPCTISEAAGVLLTVLSGKVMIALLLQNYVLNITVCCSDLVCIIASLFEPNNLILALTSIDPSAAGNLNYCL